MNKSAKETRELNPKLLLLLICGFNLFIVCFACEGLPKLQSHRRMNELIASVQNYPLPPDTRVKSIESEILESPGGTGDYCLYDIEQKMVTTLSKDEIESYYENAAVPGVNSFGNERGIMVYFPDEQPDDNELVFIIAVYDMTEHIFTPRCK